MWFRKSSPRRLAIREDVVEAESLSRPLPKPYGGGPALMGLVFFVVAALIVCFPHEPLPYHVGDRPTMALRTRVDFTLDDPDERAQRQKDERDRTPPILLINPAVLDQIDTQLENLATSIRDVHTVADLDPSIAARFPGLDARAIAVVQTDPAAYLREVKQLMAQLAERPIVDPTLYALIVKRDNAIISETPNFNPKKLSPPLDHTEVLVLGDKKIRDLVTAIMPQQLFDPLTAYLLKLEKPTFTYDETLTTNFADYRASRPLSREFKKDTVLVEADEEISPTQYRALQVAESAWLLELENTDPWAAWRHNWLARVGQAIAVASLTIVGVLYARRMNPNIRTPGRGWALCGLLLLMLFIAKNAATLLPQARFSVGTAPTLLATVIMIIAFNPRFAIAIAAIHGLLVTFALGQGLDFFLVMMTGIAIYAFGLAEIRSVAKVIEVGVFAAAGMFGCAWAVGMARMGASVFSIHWVAPTDLNSIATGSFWAAFGGILVLPTVFPLIPMIERLFKTTTAMTLLGLCDANRPLLRRLAQEAPGTFNHSLTVGIMAEAAADSIGANGLLVRAGAYYHDVGKLSKPQYFIENQAGGPNRHEKLSPAMSLLIIVGHVKDGVELAREYNLPSVLHQFIAQHHGTTLVEYFYNAARKRQGLSSAIGGGGPDETEVRESEFRYPGPRPQNKETAILMICDGAESMIRSLPDKSPGRVETAIHNLIMKRLMDGQFSDCDLTLKELSRIESALTRALAGIYHGRVQYPTPLIMAETA